MMVEFINSLTGTRMTVAPEREAEYLAAGHIRVSGAPAAPKAGQAAAAPSGASPAQQPAAAAGKAPAAAKPASKTPRPAAKKKPAARRGAGVKK